MHCRRDYLNGPYIYFLMRNFDLQAHSLIFMVRVGGQKASVIQEFLFIIGIVIVMESRLLSEESPCLYWTYV